jgi:hypothetical protein
MASKTFSVLAVLLAGFTQSPAFALSESNFLSEYKSEVISVCGQKSNKEEKMSCLVSAGSNLEAFRLASEDVRFSGVIKDCRTHQENRSNKNPRVALSECVAMQVNLIQEHPYPDLRRLIFELDSLRSNWLSNCLSSGRNGHSSCLRKKEMEFNRFWSFYLSDSVTVVKEQTIKNCLYSDGRPNDFLLINKCIGIN